MIALDKIKVHIEDNKKWRLPVVLEFNRIPFKYDVIGFRNPKKGEYFLSGAIVEVYEAPNDLSTKYLIVKPTIKMKISRCYVECI